MIGFWRIQVTGTDLSSLEEIKTFVESKFNPNEFWKTPTSQISEDIDSLEYIYTCDLYLIKPNKVNRYTGFVNGAWSGWAKTGLLTAKMLEFEDCTHDSENPTPCTPTTVFNWSK